MNEDAKFYLKVVLFVLGVFVLGVLVWAIIVYGFGTGSAPRFFDLFMAAFQTCMASEQFSRDECLIVAHAMLGA